MSLPERTKAAALDASLCAEAVATCACFNIRKASRAMTQLFDDALQPCGLRSTQLVILLSVAGGEAPTIAELARTLVMDPSTLNRSLRPLEKRGLLKIDADGRRRAVVMTTAGANAVKRAVPLWKKVQAEFIEAMGDEDWPRLLLGLRNAVEATRR